MKSVAGIQNPWRNVIKRFLIPLVMGLLFTAILSMTPVYGSDNTMTIRGYICDELNNPVAYQEVDYYLLDDNLNPVGSRKSATTNAEGIYSFSPITCYPSDLNRKFQIKTQNPGVTGGVSKYIGNFNTGIVNWDFNIVRYGTTVIKVRDENGAAVPPGVPMWLSYSSPSTGGSSWPWTSPADGISPHHTTDGNGNISLRLRATWFFDGVIGKDANCLGGFNYGYAAGEREYGGINQTYNMVDSKGIDQTSELRYELPSNPDLRDDMIDISSQAGKTRELTFYVRPLGKVTAFAKNANTSQSLPNVHWNYSSGSGFLKYSNYSSDGSSFSTYGYGADTITISASDPSDPAKGYLGYESASASTVVDDWGVESVTLSLRPNSAGIIRGRVIDSSGNGIPDASVELLWPANSGGYSIQGFSSNYHMLKTLTTDSNGSYSFTNVVPTSGQSGYTVRVTKPDYNIAAAESIMLTSGETKAIEDLTIAPDSQPPYWSNYSKLEIDSLGWTGVMLKWTEAHDETGVKGYKIYQGETLLTDTGTDYVIKYSTIQYKIGSLAPGTTYDLSVKPYDAAGNIGEPLSTSFTTLQPYKISKVIRASVNSEGLEANGDSKNPVISSDGRFVVLSSLASNLCEGDNNNAEDVFLFDRNTGILKCISLTPEGTTGSRKSYSPAISADGHFVAFASDASNLVANDTNTKTDIFVYDTSTQMLKLVSTGLNGEAANGYSYSPSLSGDGSYIAFSSSASNLVQNDLNGKDDVFVVDMNSALATRVSYQPNGSEVTGSADNPVISTNGRFITYEVYANYKNSIYVYDRDDQTTELITKSYSDPAVICRGYNPDISGDGRYITFYSSDSNLVESDNNSKEDVFVYDPINETMQLVSISSSGQQGDNYSTYSAISDNGRFVAFKSMAKNLIEGDSNGCYDVLVRDLVEGTTERVSVAADGTEGDEDSSWNECPPAISADGRFIAYDSDAENLVSNDKNSECDIFIYDRGAGGQTLTVSEAVNPANVQVGYGTPIDQVSLPTKVILVLSDNSQIDADVNWTTEGYNGNLAGEYVITGSLVNLPQTITNPLAVGVELKIIVQSQPSIISSIEIIGQNRLTIPGLGDPALTVTYSAKVKDQMGNEMAGEEVVWSLNGAAAGISLNGNQLTITDQAQGGTAFTLAAASVTDNSIKAEWNISLETMDECFIATAAYGSKLAPTVTLLRQFRDEYLLSNVPGQAFVTFYYTHSPALADTIAENIFLKLIARILLLPVIVFAWAMMNYKIVVMVLVFVMVCRRIKRRSLIIPKV